MVDGSAEKNLTSKPSPDIWDLYLRTYFSNVCLLALLTAATAALCQTQSTPPGTGPIATLYRRISTIGLDPKQVYNVRGAALDREDVHFSLDDGTIAFTEAIDGRITGALFDGEGTVLIVPPNNVEKHSLGMFTGSAVMNEHFTRAYFRFDDSRFVSDLGPYLQPLDDPAPFAEQHNSVAKSLAGMDSLRLLLSLTRSLPSEAGKLPAGEFIHGRFVGTGGTFDVGWDTAVHEQISAGQSSFTDHGAYYDQWMLFSMRSVRQRDAERLYRGLSNDEFYEDSIDLDNYTIRARVTPPGEMAIDTTLKMVVRKNSNRLLLFELSRYLKLSSVTMEKDSKGDPAAPLEFIQNEAIEGTDLARRGNDLIAIAFPRELKTGETVDVHFVYSGSVLTDAGGGLLYVGDRGAWYPNRGPVMSNFDLQFEAPAEWKLLATGKLTSQQTNNGIETTRWVSERDIPLAGFNLGRYAEASEKTEVGNIEVLAYATQGVESTFAGNPANTAVVHDQPGRPPIVVFPPSIPLVPAKNVQIVAERARDTIDFMSARFGPYPYSSLRLTQIPGTDSQGWPGLIYLSGHVFLTPEQRAQGRGPEFPNSFEELIYNRLMEAHETAHQWWGDAVLWQSYRDQWLMEALANYSALLEIEARSPVEAKDVLDFYRNGLVTPPKGESKPKMDAGPVTFGLRLNSAPFPRAYEAVAYGRGTWLIHMLRELLREPGGTAGRARATTKGAKEPADPDAVFDSLLRGLQKKYAGKTMSTQDLQLALEDVWPANLRYEGKKSLSWFFDGWVNGTSVPKYELNGVKYSEAGGKRTARATLVQNEAPDSLVTIVPIYAQTATGLVFVDRVFADGNETALKLPVPVGTKKLVIDPYETVLRVR